MYYHTKVLDLVKDQCSVARHQSCGEGPPGIVVRNHVSLGVWEHLCLTAEELSLGTGETFPI